jgi:hypothetical protein
LEFGDLLSLQFDVLEEIAEQFRTVSTRSGSGRREGVETYRMYSTLFAKTIPLFGFPAAAAAAAFPP